MFFNSHSLFMSIIIIQIGCQSLVDEQSKNPSQDVLLLVHSTSVSIPKEDEVELSGLLADQLSNQRTELAEQLCLNAQQIGEGLHQVDSSYAVDLITGNCQESWFRPISHRGDIAYSVLVPAGSGVKVRALGRTQTLETRLTLSEDPNLKLAIIDGDARYCGMEYAPGIEQRLSLPILPCEASAHGGMDLTWVNQTPSAKEMLLLVLDLTTACAYLEEGCDDVSPPLYLELSFFTPGLGDLCNEDAPLINLHEDISGAQSSFVSDLNPQSLDGFSSAYPKRLWVQRINPLGELEGDSLSCRHSSGRERVYRVEVPAHQTIYAIQGPFDVFFSESAEGCERSCTSSVSRHFSNSTDDPQVIFVIVGEREGEPLNEPFNLQLRSITTRLGSLCSSPLLLDQNQRYGDIIEFQSPNIDYPTTDNYQIGYLTSAQQELGDRVVPLSSLSAERCAVIDDRPDALNGPERIYQIIVPAGEEVTVEVEVQDMSTEGELSWGPDFNLSLNLALEDGAICERDLKCVAHSDASAHTLTASYFNPTEHDQILLGIVESATTSQLLSLYSFDDHPFVSYYIRYTRRIPLADERMSSSETTLDYHGTRTYDTLNAQSLEGFKADYSRGWSCQPYADDGADRVYRLVMPAHSKVVVTARPERMSNDLDLVLNLFDEDVEQNESTARACLVPGVDQHGRGGSEVIEYNNLDASSRTIFLVVSAYDAARSIGRFSLTATHSRGI